MAAPWTRHYDPEVPPSLAPYPARTLVDYVRETRGGPARRARDFFQGHDALEHGPRSPERQVRRGARRAGIRKGDRVALLLPNCPQFLIAEIGAWKAGATVLPLNPLYTASELREPLDNAGAEVVVTLTPFYKRLKDIQRETPVKRIIATSIKEYLPPLAPRAVYALQGKEGRAPHRARARRSVVPGLSEGLTHRKGATSVAAPALPQTTPPSC